MAFRNREHEFHISVDMHDLGKLMKAKTEGSKKQDFYVSPDNDPKRRELLL